MTDIQLPALPPILLEAKKTLDAPQDVSKWKNADYKEFFVYMRDLNSAAVFRGQVFQLSQQVKDAVAFIPNLVKVGTYLIFAEIHNNDIDPNENQEFDWIFTKAMANENDRKYDEIESSIFNPRFGRLELIKMMAKLVKKYLKQFKTQLTDTSYSKIIKRLVGMRPYGIRKEGLYKHLSKKTKESKYEDTLIGGAITEAMKLRQEGGMFENPKERNPQKMKVFTNAETPWITFATAEEAEAALKKSRAAREPPTPPAPTKKKTLVLKKPKEVAKAAMASVREVVKMEKTPKLKKQFIERVRKELDEFEKTLIPQKELDADMEKARTAVAKARALRRISKAKAEMKEDDKKY